MANFTAKDVNELRKSTGVGTVSYTHLNTVM